MNTMCDAATAVRLLLLLLQHTQVLTFTSSLFGDLIESIMKRDAGLKVGEKSVREITL